MSSGEGQEAALTGWVYFFFFGFTFLWSFAKGRYELRNEILKCLQNAPQGTDSC